MGRVVGLGRLFFLVDSDTIVPEDLFGGCGEGDGGVSDGGYESGEDC
jgi:hypothetical protein